MGLPNCILVLAENQRRVAQVLHEKGSSVNMGWFTTINQTTLAQTMTRMVENKSLRSQMSSQGRACRWKRGSSCGVEITENGGSCR